MDDWAAAIQWLAQNFGDPDATLTNPFESIWTCDLKIPGAGQRTFSAVAESKQGVVRKVALKAAVELGWPGCPAESRLRAALDSYQAASLPDAAGDK